MQAPVYSARRRLALAAALAVTLGVEAAGAQTPAPPPTRPAPQPLPAPAKPAEEDDGVQDVVVTGKRLPGAVIGDIKPELTLSPADIQSYGVSTIAELLDELAPETRSGRGRGGEAPVVLLNGHRISSFAEIRDIPTEAILRAEILPEEVALKYGYTANQRVVNIVLRPFFRAITGEGTIGAPTEGGQLRGQAEGDLFHLRRDNRLNIDLRLTGNAAITDAARHVTETTNGPPFDLRGNVVSPTGGQVDPALSALAGQPVSVAGAPASAAGGRPALADFVPTANIANLTDISHDRTLASASRAITLNAVNAMPGPFGSNVTFNGTLGATETEGRQGLPGISLSVPSTDPFSPFGSTVAVLRYDNAFGPLRQTTQGWTGHLGLTANRDSKDWRYSLTSAYDHADSLTATDAGLDASALQALLNAGSPGFNPFGPLPVSGLAELAQNKARSFSDSGNIQVLASGDLFAVPAGKFSTSLKFGDSIANLDSHSARGGVAQSTHFTRNTLNAQANFDLPVLSDEDGWLGVLGEVSLNGNLAIDQLSDFGALATYGYGVNWTPLTGVNLIASQTHDKAAPSQQQLGGPTIATPGVAVFDYASGQTVRVTSIGGGNAALTGDSRTVSKIGLTWKPIANTDLTLSANYIYSDIKNPIATFPAATAEIEAAFPGRFLRDASGRLTSIDYRPVNFADQRRAELRWGVNFTMPVGPAPPPRPDRPRRREGSPPGGDGGGRQRGSGERGPGFGGGGRGGGFGGGGFAARVAQQGRLQVAVYHTYYFTDQILARPGGPLFDLLNGSAAGSNGGQPRQEVELQFGYTQAGFGGRLSADWKSATSVNGAASPAGQLNFSDLATVNLRLFVNFAAQPEVIKAWPWLRGARLSAGINNLFDARQKVTDANGVTPISYQPAYLDPVGRVVSVSFRKLFF